MEAQPLMEVELIVVIDSRCCPFTILIICLLVHKLGLEGMLVIHFDGKIMKLCFGSDGTHADGTNGVLTVAQISALHSVKGT